MARAREAPGDPQDDVPRRRGARCGALHESGALSCEQGPLHEGRHAAGDPVVTWADVVVARPAPVVSREPNTALGTASWLST